MDWELTQNLYEQEELERRKEAERNAIRAQISVCEEQKAILEMDLRELTQKLELQQQEKGKFEQGVSVYQEERMKKSARLDELSLLAPYVKIVSGYESMQGDRIRGSIASNNLQRLEQMSTRMQSEIEKNKEKWELLNLELKQCNQQIENLYEQLWRI